MIPVMMKVSTKLKKIQEAAKLSQEAMARMLGVSFPTLNSWILDKSVPRSKHRERIDALYAKYFGTDSVDLDILQTKREEIDFKSKKYENVLSLILNRKDLRDSFDLSLTYNSNAIEGSTMTLHDTADVLFHDRAPRNRSVTEQMEAKNHSSAFQYLLDYLARHRRVDEALLLKLHAILMNGICEGPGSYRTHQVRIVGSFVPTASFHNIPARMDALFREYDFEHMNSEHLARFHAEFEQIHPFSDGNGRVGRLLLHAGLLINNLPPAVIAQEHKGVYYKYLNKAQLQKEYYPLELFLCDAIMEGYKIIDGDVR